MFLKNGGHRQQQTDRIVNNCWRGFVTDPSTALIKERRKQRQWVRPSIRKTEGKGAYYSIINDLKLTDKEDFRKYLRMNTSTFQVI